MRRVFPPAIPGIMFIGSPFPGPGDAAVSIEDTAGFGNEVAANVSQTSNSSAGATITITMTGILDE